MKRFVIKTIAEFIEKYVIEPKIERCLLSHDELQKLICEGVIDADPANVNAASIDITLHKVILQEGHPRFNSVINLAQKENIETSEISMTKNGYTLSPGEFLLASSRETFNLPDDISAEYKLKSSQARNGLDHANAGWAGAGWNNSKLTLEFKNISARHHLTINTGMKCGQMVFFKHKKVPRHASYATRGQYNGQSKVTASKGVR